MFLGDHGDGGNQPIARQPQKQKVTADPGTGRASDGAPPPSAQRTGRTMGSVAFRHRGRGRRRSAVPTLAWFVEKETWIMIHGPAISSSSSKRRSNSHRVGASGNAGNVRDKSVKPRRPGDALTPRQSSR